MSLLYTQFYRRGEGILQRGRFRQPFPSGLWLPQHACFLARTLQPPLGKKL